MRMFCSSQQDRLQLSLSGPLFGNCRTALGENVAIWQHRAGKGYTDCAVFSSDTTSIGFALIKDLEPDTMYSFTLFCGGTDETITRHIRTVYGRPSPPRNITATLVSERLRISWLPHSVPNEPIHNYKLANGSKIISDEIGNSQLSYSWINDHIYGKKLIFFSQLVISISF
ncbi:unnamed protein product [Rotaria socialis]|uniref:Fibronectin type-III domain-containing protein n=1 Tax=Rotaria socialis TaxID=392032 RepID=A0A818XRX3_9BILA|nr:unnamed protein product [Rotaria socialis]